MEEWCLIISLRCDKEEIVGREHVVANAHGALLIRAFATHLTRM